jgi:hypothetical protein
MITTSIDKKTEVIYLSFIFSRDYYPKRMFTCG